MSTILPISEIEAQLRQLPPPAPLDIRGRFYTFREPGFVPQDPSPVQNPLLKSARAFLKAHPMKSSKRKATEPLEVLHARLQAVWDASEDRRNLLLAEKAQARRPLTTAPKRRSEKRHIARCDLIDPQGAPLTPKAAP